MVRPSASAKLQAMREKKRERLLSKDALPDSHKADDDIGGNTLARIAKGFPDENDLIQFQNRPCLLYPVIPTLVRGDFQL
jgi:hypothetical protein